jgi:DNA-binding response OmpR family regulator
MYKIQITGKTNEFTEMLSENLKSYNFEITENNPDAIIINEAKNAIPKNSKTPIFFLSNKSDNIKNTEIITKPININSLAKHLKSEIEKHKKETTTEIKIKNLKFIKNQNLLINTSKDKTIKLTEKETEILLSLFKAKNHFKTKESLLKEIWGYSNTIETHTLETHIYKLRNKLEDQKETPKILIAQENGYKLNI